MMDCIMNECTCRKCGAHFQRYVVNKTPLTDYFGNGNIACPECGGVDIGCPTAIEMTADQRIRKFAELASEDDYAAVADTLLEAIDTDDESPSRIGYYLTLAKLKNSVDDALIAIGGWSFASLLDKAVPPDKD